MRIDPFGACSRGVESSDAKFAAGARPFRLSCPGGLGYQEGVGSIGAPVADGFASVTFSGWNPTTAKVDRFGWIQIY
jgi:hypothetical protein